MSSCDAQVANGSISTRKKYVSLEKCVDKLINFKEESDKSPELDLATPGGVSNLLFGNNTVVIAIDGNIPFVAAPAVQQDKGETMFEKYFEDQNLEEKQKIINIFTVDNFMLYCEDVDDISCQNIDICTAVLQFTQKLKSSKR